MATDLAFRMRRQLFDARYDPAMLPLIALLVGCFLIMTGSDFLLRGGAYSDGIAAVIGGGVLIVAAVWMIVARVQRKNRAQQRHGFEVPLPEDGRHDKSVD
jgi:hypothetical protein